MAFIIYRGPAALCHFKMAKEILEKVWHFGYICSGKRGAIIGTHGDQRLSFVHSHVGNLPMIYIPHQFCFKFLFTQADSVTFKLTFWAKLLIFCFIMQFGGERRLGVLYEPYCVYLNFYPVNSALRVTVFLGLGTSRTARARHALSWHWWEEGHWGKKIV